MLGHEWGNRKVAFGHQDTEQVNGYVQCWLSCLYQHPTPGVKEGTEFPRYKCEARGHVLQVLSTFS